MRSQALSASSARTARAPHSAFSRAAELRMGERQPAVVASRIAPASVPASAAARSASIGPRKPAVTLPRASASCPSSAVASSAATPSCANAASGGGRSGTSRSVQYARVSSSLAWTRSLSAACHVSISSAHARTTRAPAAIAAVRSANTDDGGASAGPAARAAPITSRLPCHLSARITTCARDPSVTHPAQP